MNLNKHDAKLLLGAVMWTRRTNNYLSGVADADLADLEDRLARECADRDHAPGDFADDGCGDPSLAPVPGMAC